MRYATLIVAACLAIAGFTGVSAQTIGADDLAVEPQEAALPDGAVTMLAQIDMTAWAAFAKSAEGIVEPSTASRFALTRLRSELSVWRDTFSDATGLNASRLATLDRQVAALTPAEGVEISDPVIAARLAELDALHTRLAQPQMLAQEAFARADGLISEIDTQIRILERARLLARGVSPANPVHWPEAGAILSTALAQGMKEVVGTTKVFEDDGRLLRRFMTVLVALVLATGFVLFIRKQLGKLAEIELSSSLRINAILRFLISVARVVLPVIGLAVLAGILTTSGFFGLTGLAVVAVLPTAGALVFYTKWLADHYFPHAADRESILGYDRETRVNARRVAVNLGRVLALSVIVDALASTTRASAVTLDVINLPIQLMVGLLLWRLGGFIVRKPLPQSTAFFRRGRVRRFIGRAAQVFAVAGPLASLLGFGAAAQAITIPTVVSLAILATIVVLIRLSFDVMSRADALHVGDGTTDTVGSGLWPIVVNFGVILLSLPVFALNWGASPADLAEVWIQFLSGFNVGGTQISPTIFITFVSVFVVGYLITGFLKTSLRTSVLPRTRLDLGGQNAITAGTGYIGIFLSALIGFSVAGIDLSSLAIVAGALSVGLGFGLQNIVSNFVSGIILLIERPIGEGDMIEVGGQMGYVRDISVRSTRIETFDKIDVIIPNADLISGQVSNWTRGNLVGRAIVAVGVAYGTDTAKVSEVLQEIAEANPIVVLNPPPSVLLVRFGADSIDFEIRAIIRDVNFVNIAKSEMYHEVVRRFAEEGIEIPFAQRDVWLRNPEVLHQSGEPS